MDEIANLKIALETAIANNGGQLTLPLGFVATLIKRFGEEYIDELIKAEKIKVNMPLARDFEPVVEKIQTEIYHNRQPRKHLGPPRSRKERRGK